MKLVLLLSRFPYPLEKGDKLRAYQHLRHLHASGHEVHVLALSDCVISEEAYSQITPYCHSVHVLRLTYLQIALNLAASFFTGIPLQVGYFYAPRLKRKVEALIGEIHPELIYCQLIRTAQYIRDIPAIPKVIDYQDAFSKGTLQRMEKSGPLLKPLFNRELRLVKRFESRTYGWFNRHLIISEQDRAALSVPANKPVFILPNGVDTTYFFPTPSAKKTDVTFIGNMNYPPNVDGAKFLVEEIMPLVWNRIPGAKVTIGGANPHKSVRSLASERVSVTGWVDDIRDCYREARVFVAPMRMGTGLQNKLLEAMAMGIPSVTTSMSFYPLGATEGKQVLTGNTAAEIAEQIIALLQNEEMQSRIGNAGMEFVREAYSLNHSRLLLDSIIRDAVQD